MLARRRPKPWLALVLLPGISSLTLRAALGGRARADGVCRCTIDACTLSESEEDLRQAFLERMKGIERPAKAAMTVDLFFQGRSERVRVAADGLTNTLFSAAAQAFGVRAEHLSLSVRGIRLREGTALGETVLASSRLPNCDKVLVTVNTPQTDSPPPRTPTIE